MATVTAPAPAPMATRPGKARGSRRGAFGILFAPVDMWIKAYFAMGAALLIQSCITLAKTVRDMHEGTRMVNRIEDAKAERLLMGIERGS